MLWSCQGSQWKQDYKFIGVQMGEQIFVDACSINTHYILTQANDGRGAEAGKEDQKQRAEELPKMSRS